MLGLGAPSQSTYKFVKRFANLAPSVVSAIEEYIGEVKEGTFPGAQHCYFLPEKTRRELMRDEAMAAVLERIEAENAESAKSPEIIASAAELRRRRNAMDSSLSNVVFIPFLGGLHDGHCALIEAAKALKADDDALEIWCSLFVNPLQFNEEADYLKYPNDAEQDIAKLTALGVDLIFTPSAHEMYGDRGQFSVFVDFQDIERCSDEGRWRPGHFKGVGTVLTALFSWIRPKKTIFGQKDFLQCVLVRNLCRQFFPDSEVVVHRTVRDPDGLAMSSRNLKLSAAERARAPFIHRTLCAMASFLFDRLQSDSVDDGVAVGMATEIGMDFAKRHAVDLEYISFHRFSDGSKMESDWDLIPLLRSEQIVISIAGSVGPSTRLIDNVVIGGKDNNETLWEDIPYQAMCAQTS